MSALSPALYCRKRAFLSLQRFFSTAAKTKEEEWQGIQRKRKTEWKRQQKVRAYANPQELVLTHHPGLTLPRQHDPASPRRCVPYSNYLDVC